MLRTEAVCALKHLRGCFEKLVMLKLEAIPSKWPHATASDFHSLRTEARLETGKEPISDLVSEDLLMRQKMNQGILKVLLKWRSYNLFLPQHQTMSSVDEVERLVLHLVDQVRWIWRVKCVLSVLGSVQTLLMTSLFYQGLSKMYKKF